MTQQPGWQARKLHQYHNVAKIVAFQWSNDLKAGVLSVPLNRYDTWAVLPCAGNSFAHQVIARGNTL